MAIEALEGLSDQELFDEANSDDAPAVEVVAEPVGEPAEQRDQARDEAGRFAGKPENEPEAPSATEQPAKPPVDDNAAMVPSWRARELREERDAVAKRLEALEAERANWQQQQPTAPAKEPEKAAKPDPLLDPEGYMAAVKEEVRQELLSERRETSLANAHRTYKAEFEEAYAAAQKQVDPVLKMKMQQSRDPGETLIQWHREQKTRAEVGTDPNAYFDKRLEAYLADPANQAKMLERIRGGVQPASQGKPALTSLPPSLTRATTAATITSADDDDISDEGLWRSSNA